MKLSELIDATTPFVDVRTPEEFATGHIEGALNIPLADIATKKDEIKGLGEKPVVFYCRSGNRSGLAVHQLQLAGYGMLYNGGSLEQVRSLLSKKGIK
ncbi:rhodanese-like domain-containing protein [Pseudoflavitalea rhizosphaerae]|uniref:rhodanese-like domain-containing protein n=1 Tax=Pseudoflavitalea rhizosphaerae TaxID=1884793 RepID=UPI000F8DB619|nr:rhodanese-like domain-containing protein [Pseudoflavitalea rhizosphaerae]